MKKAGIMTFHFCDNYGALLQCYALRHTINTFPDINAEVINYNPNWSFKEYENPVIKKRYLMKLDRFDEFRKDCIGAVSPVIYDINNAEKYDYYITGSDQVWNTSFSFVNEHYFLDFVSQDAKRISYAASIGLPVDSPKLKREMFEKYIPRFDYISLREKTHIPFVSQFTDKEVCSVLDPTLLLKSDDYDELCKDASYPDGDYLFLYFLAHDNSAPLLINYANMIARKFNLKIVCSLPDIPKRSFKNESESAFHYGPKEFVSAIKHAKVVVTNSFHATIFSLLHHTPFFTFLVPSMQSRITDILEETGLSDRIIYGYRPLSDDMLDVDFSKADTVLEEKRNESIAFLKKALDIE